MGSSLPAKWWAAAGYFGSYQFRVWGFALGDELHRGAISPLRAKDICVRVVRAVDAVMLDSLRRCEPDQVQRDSLSQCVRVTHGTPVKGAN
jgi:hypothetical protein